MTNQDLTRPSIGALVFVLSLNQPITLLVISPHAFSIPSLFGPLNTLGKGTVCDHREMDKILTKQKGKDAHAYINIAVKTTAKDRV